MPFSSLEQTLLLPWQSFFLFFLKARASWDRGDDKRLVILPDARDQDWKNNQSYRVRDKDTESKGTFNCQVICKDLSGLDGGKMPTTMAVLQQLSSCCLLLQWAKLLHQHNAFSLLSYIWSGCRTNSIKMLGNLWGAVYCAGTGGLLVRKIKAGDEWWWELQLHWRPSAARHKSPTILPWTAHSFSRHCSANC